MAGEWQLGEVAIIQQGRYLPPDTMADRRSEATPVPVWGANGVIGFTDSPSYGQAVPLVTCRGNGCGLVQWTGGAAYVSNNAMAIIARTIDESDTRYLYYSLRSTDFADVTTGSAQPQITVGHLSRKKIFWTERTSERAAIAHILGTLDDKIELNRRMNETLEAMARALFKSWFVDFDPVHAKMEGRDPRLPKTLADLFPNSVEDSELGEIPSSWGTHRLGDLLSLDKGLSYKGQFLTGSGVPMVNLGCFLGRGRFDEEAIKNYSGEYQARHVVRPFDLVLANTDITQKREVLGSPAIIPPKGDITKLIFSHHVFAARFRKGQEHWKLFVYFLL
ncbi:MAG: hypothetical protein FJ279_26935, partial [Planctomycetes bacterium]|nr:hypothetical protein [Planctomycetota bacterium]